MPKRLMPPHALVAMAIAVGSPACIQAGSKWMRPVPSPPPIAPVEDAATVVVMRPSSYGSAVRFTLVDGNGVFLGQPVARSYYVLLLRPGTHDLVAWSENVDMVRARLEAGKVYYVLARVYMGVFAARVALEAFRPGHPDWSNRDDWISSSTYHELDVAGGRQHLSSKREEVLRKVVAAREAFSRLEGEARAIREI